VLLGIVPLLMMVIDSLWIDGSWSLKAYRGLLDSGVLESFGRSVWLGFWVAFASTVIGGGLGFLFAKSDIFAGKYLAILFSLPLLIPPYIFAFSWFSLLGHDALLFGFWGCFWVLFSLYLPIPLLLTMLFIRQINPALEEAARVVTGWRGSVFHITLPLLSPALFFSFLLVFVLVFGAYGVPNFLRYDVFSTLSFRQFSAFYDFKAATAFAMPLLLVVFVFLFLEYILVEKKAFSLQESYQVDTLSLGGKRGWIWMMVLGLWVLIMIVPLGSLLWQVGSVDTLMQAWQKGWQPLLHSLFFALVGASVMSFFGLLLAYVLVYQSFTWWRWLDMGILMVFVLPSTVFGISLILLWNHPWSNFIYASPVIVVLGLVGKYLALPLKIIQIKLQKIPSSFLESAALLGANWRQRGIFILLPLLKETVVIAWLVAFIFALREDTLSMLLYPAGWETLPIYTATQMANGNPHIIAGLALIMIGVMVASLGVLLWFFRRRLS